MHDKKKKAVIMLAIGMSAMFLGIASIIDVVIYNRPSIVLVPIAILFFGIFILYINLEKLLKNK